MAKPGSSNNKKATKKKTAKKKQHPAPVVKKPAPVPPGHKPNRPGRGGTVLPPSPKPFTKDNQPSAAAKKAGWAKRRILKDLLELTTGATFNNSTTDYRALTAKYFGIPDEEVTVRMVMDFRQVEKAILKGDTAAYVAVNDRAYGKPKGEEQPAKNLSITINGQRITSK